MDNKDFQGYEGLSIGILIASTDTNTPDSSPPGRIIYANPMAREKVGKNSHQISELHLHELFPELDMKRYLEFLTSPVKKARFNLHYEGTDCSLFCRKYPGHVHIELHCRQSRDVELEQDNLFLKLLTGKLKGEAIRSIQRIAQLIKENEYLKRLLDDLPMIVALKDAQLKYIYVNAEFCRFMGVSAEEIIGYGDDYFCIPKEIEYFKEIDRKVIESGQVTTTEDVYTDRQGRKHHLITKKVPVQDKDGNVAIQLVCFEITDMKRHETEIEKMAQQYEDVSRIAHSFVWAITADLEPLFYSPTAEDFYGYSIEEIYALNLRKLLSQKTYEHTKELMAALRDLHQRRRYNEMTKTHSTTFECIHKDGSIIIADVRYAAILDLKNNFVGIRGINIKRL